MSEFFHSRTEHGQLFAAPIESIGELVAVARQVLFGNLMERPINSTLEQAEGILYALRVILALYVGNYVINHSVPPYKVIAANPAVRETAVRLQERVYRNVLAQMRLNRNHFVISNRNQAEFPAAFNHSEHGAAIGITHFRAALARFSRPQKSFVCFHKAGEFAALLHRFTDSVRKVPRCPIVDAQVPLKLASAHPLLGFTDQRNREKPLRKRQVRVMEYRATGSAELLSTRETLKETYALILALRFTGDFRNAANLSTMNAANLTIGPAQRFKVIQAIIVGSEFGGYVYGFHGDPRWSECPTNPFLCQVHNRRVREAGKGVGRWGE